MLLLKLYIELRCLMGVIFVFCKVSPREFTTYCDLPALLITIVFPFFYTLALVLSTDCRDKLSPLLDLVPFSVVFLPPDFC